MIGNNEVKKKIAVYLRVSTEEQTEMYGIEHQKSKIMSYVESRSDYREPLSENNIFYDDGISGTTDVDHRKELKRLFDMLEYAPEGQRPFDLVIVYKIDRFARRLSVLLDIVDRFRTYGVGFASCTESIDTDSPFGNAMLGILGVFAELERSLIQERTLGGRNEAVKNGERMNDKYGYKRVGNIPEIFGEEASVVKTIFDLYVNKRLTIAQIASKLREDKVLIPAASRATHKIDKNNRPMQDPYKRGDKTLRDILSDEVYIGVYYYNKSTSIKNPKTGARKLVELPKEERTKSEVGHMFIIDDALFNKAQDLLSNKGGFTNQKEDSDYILSGLLKCGCCTHLRREQKPLSIKGLPGGGKSYYQCNGKNSKKFEGRRCRLIPLPKKELEDFIVSNIKKFMSNPTTFYAFVEKHKSNGVNTSQVEKEIQLAYNELHNLSVGLKNTEEMYSKGHIDTTKYDKFISDNKNQTQKTQNKISELKRSLNQQADEDKYHEGIKLMHSIIGNNLDNLFNDRKMLRQFLGYIISEIYVYGREADTNDRVTGRKKKGGENQQIPNNIDIRMRLPQEILESLYQEIKKLERQDHTPSHGLGQNKVFHQGLESTLQSSNNSELLEKREKEQIKQNLNKK